MLNHLRDNKVIVIRIGSEKDAFFSRRKHRCTFGEGVVSKTIPSTREGPDHNKILESKIQEVVYV